MKKIFLILFLLAASRVTVAQQKLVLTAAASSCTASNASCLVTSVDPTQGGTTFTISANAGGNTIQFEASGDGGTTWVAFSVTPSNSSTSVTSTTSTGTWQGNIAGYTNIRMRMSTLVSGTTTVSAIQSTASARGGSGSGGGGGGGGTSSSLSTAYTFYPATLSSCVISSYSPTGTTYCALNNVTGAVDFSGTDAGVVFRSAVAAHATTGGLFFFKLGTYNINSLVLEAASGCNNFGGVGIAVAYGLGFPANTPYSSSVQWHLEGETNAVWQGEDEATAINTAGVIFNVTPTGVSSVAPGSLLNVIWQSPVTNCTLINTNVSNDIFISNIAVRFPTNQRGNEVGINMWFTGNHTYFNDTADFNLPYATMAGTAPVAGTYGSFGMTTSVSGSGAVQKSTSDFVTGWNIAYDDLSEHTFSVDDDAIYSNFPFELGRTGVNQVIHSVRFTHFLDQENLNGGILGPEMSVGSRVDMDLDIEFGNDANWYSSRGIVAGMTETNPCDSSGIITYSATQAFNTNVAGTPLFLGTGGQCFVQFNSFTPFANPNRLVFESPLLTQNGDAFSRGNAATLGSFWVAPPVGPSNSGLQIVSNTAQVNAATLASGFETYTGTTNQSFSSNQAAKVTIPVLNTNANSFVEVLTNASSTDETFYSGYCSNASATGSGFTKNLAGVGSVLASQTSVAGCAAGDTIELRHIGFLLYFYKNGILDTDFTPNPATDSSVTAITGGSPGLFIGQSAAGAVGVTNFVATNNPTVGASQATNIGADSGVFPLLFASVTQGLPILVGSLPGASAANAGQTRTVSDSTTVTLEGQTCVGSGAVTAIAFSNGTVWKCF